MALPTVRVRNATDTHVQEGKPSANFANSTRLGLDERVDYRNRAYIFFARPFPLGAKIVSAKLKVYQQGDWSGSNTLSVKRVTESWKVGKVTWKNQPTTTGTGEKTATKTNSKGGAEWEFDVTAHMQLVSNGTRWYGWQITIAGDSTTKEWLHSSQSDTGKFKPVLEVTYAVPPDPPDTLTPSGGRYVSTDKPVLAFDYDDGNGDELKAFEIQVANNSAMTGAWSHTQMDNDASIDLAETTYPGVAAGSSAYWRVRVQDEAGEWSKWSDVAFFRHAAKGTLTITSPSGNIVRDSSPTISWSLTGVTQRAWRVFLRDADGDIIYDSGKYTSADTSWTIPERYNGRKLIKHKGSEYVVVVRTWDTIDREDKQAVYEAAETFSFRESTTPVAPSKPTVVDLSPEPGFEITWTRGTEPQRFVIWRKAEGDTYYEKVDSFTEPSDLLVSGTTYRYVDYEARPGVRYQYQIGVAENINGVNEQNVSPESDLTAEKKAVRGIWIIDPDVNRTVKVCLMDADEGSWEMGEESAVFTPIGSNRVTVVTQALRGYEGSISGLLVDTGGQTVKKQEENMFKLKSTPGKTYTLVLSDVTLPAVIANVTVAPTPHKENVKEVSFEFYQQGDLPFRSRL